MLLVLLLSGCGETSQDAAPPQTSDEAPATTETTDRTRTTEPPPTEPTGETTVATTRERKTAPTYGYTYGQASGNRIVDGTGDLPNSVPLDVPLDGAPLWVIGVPLENDTAWVIALEDGRLQAFRLDGSGTVVPVSISPNQLAPGQPPLVKAENGSLELVLSRIPQASLLTHPVPVSPGDADVVGVERNGQVFVSSGENPGILAPPDAHAVRSSSGQLAILSDPTTRYQHAVLGDAVEADSMTVLRPVGEDGFEAGSRIAPASGGVFELVAPLWFGMQGVDGDLLAVTESTQDLATRVSVYGPDGTLVAAGPFIGEPMKWRHLMAAGPFGPNGEIELVATLTPHLGGIVEFYGLDFEAGTLEITATMPGYASHRIYTRNMDTARAGDLDGDGRWELLIPNQDYTELGAIRHEVDGAAVAWTLPAGGTISTNLASATNPEGRAQIAAGRTDGVLRIWP